MKLRTTLNQNSNSVAIILVSYKGVKDTKDCLESLSKVMFSTFDIIVVNNCPEDSELLADVCKEFTNVIMLEANGNIGFSGGNNLGIRYAQKHDYKYILLLNNDTVVEPSFLCKLMNVAIEKPDVGIVTGTICYYNPSDIIWYAGGDISFSKGYIDHWGYGKKYNPDDKMIKEISFASGCLWLLPIETVETVGLMEENYFLYSEDADYCCRVIRNGLKIYFAPEARIYHKVSSSSSKVNGLSQYYSVRNDYYVFKKYAPTKMKNRALIMLTWRKLKEIIKGNIELKWYLRGTIDFFKGIQGKINL